MHVIGCSRNLGIDKASDWLVFARNRFDLFNDLAIGDLFIRLIKMKDLYKMFKKLNFSSTPLCF